MFINLLWADDDCDNNLSPLGWLLEDQRSFSLNKARNYIEAMDVLREVEPDDSTRIQSMLLDTILPHSPGNGSLSRYLGLTLADSAAQLGVKSIVFLSVVPRIEVKDKYDNLRSQYSAVHFHYVDKTSLLEYHEIESIVEHLSRLTSVKQS